MLKKISVQGFHGLPDTTLGFDTPWTVLVGKGSAELLRAIAIGAVGATRANQLAHIPSIKTGGETRIVAEFSPGEAVNEVVVPVGHYVARSNRLTSSRPVVFGYGRLREVRPDVFSEFYQPSSDYALRRLSNLFDKSEVYVERSRPAPPPSQHVVLSTHWVAQIVSYQMPTGLVLVEELDMHLPPAHQFGAIKALKEAFPNYQFIVSANSPMLISSLWANEVIRLDGPTRGRSPVLLTMDEVYEDFFAP